MPYFLYVENEVVSDAKNKSDAIEEANKMIAELVANGAIEWLIEEEEWVTEEGMLGMGGREGQ